MRRYYTLAELIDGKWCIAFGDYSRQIVDQERKDMCANYPYPKAKNFRIISTDHNQSAIDAAIANLNQGKSS